MTDTESVAAIRLLNREPVLEVIDLSTGHHRVMKVNQRYLYKQSASPTALEREAVGLYLFGRLTNHVPRLLMQGELFVLTECLEDSTTASQAIEKGLITKSQVETFVAGFMAKIYWQWQRRQDNLSMFSFLSFANQLHEIKQSLGRLEPQLAHYLPQVRRLSRQLTNLQASTEHQRLTLTHRDIHLDNILISFKDGYPHLMVIDLEHCMEGPIELELQNALFWKDQKSLDVASIRQRLTYDFRVPYSKKIESELMVVYVADQLHLAGEQSDTKKIKLVMDRYTNYWSG